jgi:putative toxin-antitoxin system antitoxin component (TIGR02293 family)
LSTNLGKWQESSLPAKKSVRSTRELSSRPTTTAVGKEPSDIGRFFAEDAVPFERTASRRRRTKYSGQAVSRDLATAAAADVPSFRVEPQALATLARHGYSDAEISALVVPKRTLARRQAKNEPLTVEETDKALRLDRVAKHAERVFGDPAKAYRWLRKPKDRLGGEMPLAFLASESGARMVEQMLHQIEHGMFA